MITSHLVIYSGVTVLRKVIVFQIPTQESQKMNLKLTLFD